MRVGAIPLLELSDRIECVARCRSFQLAVADGKRIIVGGGAKDHLQAVVIVRVRREALQGRALGGNEDHFLRFDLSCRRIGNRCMSQMNGIERTSEQCNSSMSHELLTINLCVSCAATGPNHTLIPQEPQRNKKHLHHDKVKLFHVGPRIARVVRR